eukprot:CAMPEP_0203763788 /NCGR_PEP_ID=MMETSP0098-20131031/16871_1 /ASSEMBLY_ACC=CAM_ASM_000208 /TAXON_ID=96639 /ORGANISM=" , Strain NY0313808BC1" /LENGTH=268 /DNA_ID=CAMNT_0050659013 /DNA_START=80 /DNA_END=886 /DNA_ORIENTATION=-
MAGMFVASLYIAPESVRNRDHGDPVQIKYRFRSMGIVCLATPLSLLYWSSGHVLEDPSLATWCGFRTDGILQAALYPLGLLVSLFAGTLVDMYYTHSKTSSSFFHNCPPDSPQRLRNLLVAPFAEELVFRCCMGSLLLSCGLSHGWIIATAPLFFGVAHLHHCYGMIKRGRPINEALLISFVQLCYTTAFGALEMFFFLRTGHLVSVFLVHSFCNLMGLPSLAFNSKGNINFQERKIIWTVYLLGITGFALGLGPLTRPDLYKNHLLW